MFAVKEMRGLTLLGFFLMAMQFISFFDTQCTEEGYFTFYYVFSQINTSELYGLF